MLLIRSFGYEGRIVGGFVRNFVVGLKESTDIDIATTMPAQELLLQLKQTGLKCIPTGIAYGTITVIADGMPVEITTLRKDVETDGRHAIVEYTSSWFEDSLRRDFTFNAMYMDINEKIYDYHDGISDLYAKKIRFVGDPYNRIREDYLRILRYIRFLTQYAPDFYDSKTIETIRILSPGMSTISGERIYCELIKMFSSDNILKTLPRFMWLFQELLMVHENCFHLPTLSKPFLSMPSNYRLASLLSLSGINCVDFALSRLRASNKFKHICKNILYLFDGDNYVERLLTLPADDREQYLRVLQLKITTNHDVLKNIKYEFDITGRDIIQVMPLIKRTEISSVIKSLKDVWIKSHGNITKSELLAMLETLVNQ